MSMCFFSKCIEYNILKCSLAIVTVVSYLAIVLLLYICIGFTLGKFFGSRSNIFDLKAEIKKIMFDNDRMLPVSTDGGLFTMLMANFSQFEKMVITITQYM